MTQRAELSAVLDRLAVDEVITGYAAAVDDGDWAAYQALFAPDGRADYRSSGGIAAGADEVAVWLAEMMRLFPMRQHLIVNRRVTVDDPGHAHVRADYVNPMRLAGAAPEGAQDTSAPNFISGGTYTFSLLRTDAGWRIREVTVHEKWRRM
jgi:3-phenylpropionate/cinnamic acid dioxygenase small subunit